MKTVDSTSAGPKIEDFEDKFKKTNKVAARNFPDYAKLEKLRKDVANAKKKKQFLRNIQEFI